MIVPALIAKFLSAGAVAQAATGAGVVVVAVTGAGTVGVLPGETQETFSDLTGINETVDQPVDGIADPDGTEPVEGGELADPTDPTLELDEEEADAGAFDAEVWAKGYDPDKYSSFGEWVSQGAHNKALIQEALAAGEYRNFGEMVSEEARNKGIDADELEDELAEEDLDLGDLTDGETDATEQESEAGTDDSDSTSTDKGNGKAKAGKGQAKGAGNGKGRG